MGGSETEYEERVARLNMLVNEAVKRVRALKADDTTALGVRASFAAVDQVLVDHHYQILFRTPSLWDMLTPGIPNNGETHQLTEPMKKHQEMNPGATFYRFDCDTGSMVHLSVWERLGKPVFLVELPEHVFIRWQLSESNWVNWDVNASASYTDQRYRRRFALPKEEEERMKFLQNMPQQEVKMYHLSLLAKMAHQRGDLDKAVRYFTGSIEGRPHANMNRNNFAWMIATERGLQKAELLDVALKEARRAVEMSPKDHGYIDTLAAVYAARGDFESAIRTEETGKNSRERIEAYRKKKTPAELGWK